MLELLNDILETSVRNAVRLGFNKENEVARIGVSLYATIIGQCESQISLLRADKHTGVEVILRSSLEAYIDLKNLLKDESYIGYLNANHHKEWIRIAKEGLENDNPHLVGFSKSRENAAILAEHEADLAALKAGGLKPMSVRERFIRADCGDLYSSVYNVLCAESHNDIRALVERHIRLRDSGFEVILFAEPSEHARNLTMDSIAVIFLNAGALIHEYFQTGLSKEFHALMKRLQVIRASH